MPAPVLSLQAIADQAGVSKMSVSRALAKKAGVSKELREKILKIAEANSYRPNPLIMALMANLRMQRAHRSVDTGTVLAFIERADQIGEARTEHFQGAERAAQEQGYKLEPFILGKAGLKPERLNDILLARNIPGVIIAPLPEGHGHFDLDWSRLCAVAIEYTFTNPTFDRVVHDSYASMRLILEKCRSRGFRRVGLLFSANGRERTEGLNEAAYWMEQKTTGAFCAIPPFCQESWNERAVTNWFERYKPEIIICSGAFWGSISPFLRKWRRQIGAEVLVFHDNVNSVHLTGITQNNQRMGETAIQLLIDKINRNDRGIPAISSIILIPGNWVEGEALAPAGG